MKTTLVALILTAFMAPAMSHDKVHDHEYKKGQHMMERLDKELGLSDELRQQVQAVFAEQHARHKALRAETKGRLNEILDAEQQTRLEQLRAERRARWQEKREQWKAQKTSH